MALTGSYTRYWEELSLTESQSISTTYPLGIPEGEDFYDLRGQTITSTVSASVMHSQSYSSVYIKINGVTLAAEGVEDGLYNTDRTLTYAYQVFPDAASKATSGSLILVDTVAGVTHDFDVTSNPFETAYTDLKTHQGFENLTDAI